MKYSKALIMAGLMMTTQAFAADLAHGDKSFIEKAAHAGQVEIEASKLAQTKATSPEVKSFADQMIKDHEAVASELSTLATAKGVKLPDDPSPLQKGKLKLLNTHDGASFDKHYMSDIGVDAHKDAVKLFEKASRDAKDPELKAWAAKTLPALQHHLEMAQTLNAEVKKMPATK